MGCGLGKECFRKETAIDCSSGITIRGISIPGLWLTAETTGRHIILKGRTGPAFDEEVQHVIPVVENDTSVPKSLHAQACIAWGSMGLHGAATFRFYARMWRKARERQAYGRTQSIPYPKLPRSLEGRINFKFFTSFFRTLIQCSEKIRFFGAPTKN